MSNIMGGDSDKGDKLKELLPILLSQVRGSNSPMSSQLGALLPALLSNNGDSLDPGMMMQILSNPEISNNPQLMALLLSKAEGDSDKSLSPMLMYALSQTNKDGSNNGINMMNILLPMLLKDDDSSNNTDSMSQILPFLLQFMQSNNQDPQSQLLSMALANPSIVTENPGLIPSLLNQPSMTGNSPTSFGATPSNNLPLPVLMSLLSGKPLDPLSLLALSGNGLQTPNAMGQGFQPFGYQNQGIGNTFGSQAFSNPAGFHNTPSQPLTNPALSTAMQSILGSKGSSTDKMLISLLMNSLNGQTNSAVHQPLNFMNTAPYQPANQLQQQFNPQYPGFNLLQQQGFNSAPKISPFKPFASEMANHLQPSPVNQFQLANSGSNSNGFATAMLSGRDNEHSSYQVSHKPYSFTVRPRSATGTDF